MKPNSRSGRSPPTEPAFSFGGVWNQVVDGHLNRLRTLATEQIGKPKMPTFSRYFEIIGFLQRLGCRSGSATLRENETHGHA
ncbi:MAG: hypothetical protein KF851_00370 [Pirellulaceae bacterium]|nr:hypothetical protein [Pirellulaceae bacterium]